MCLIRSIDSNMADLGLHITLLPIIGQALPRSAATCQNQLLVLQIGLCLFLYVFPVFELLSVLFCSVLLCLDGERPLSALRRIDQRSRVLDIFCPLNSTDLTSYNKSPGRVDEPASR